MYNFNMIDSKPAKRLEAARIEAGHDNVQEMCDSLEWSVNTYRSHENGIRGIPAKRAKIYARAFGTSPEWILYGRSSKQHTINLVGYIGAGAEFYAIDDHANGAGLDKIDAPPGCPPNAVAVRVRGESMMPIYFDGDILIYWDRRNDIDTFINARCIVGLADGRILVKTVRRGQGGLYTLSSFNSTLIEDVEIEWCAKIEWVQPK